TAPIRARQPPINQTPMIQIELPTRAAIKPEVVKIPIPMILPTTRKAEERNPTSRNKELSTLLLNVSPSAAAAALVPDLFKPVLCVEGKFKAPSIREAPELRSPGQLALGS